MSFVETSIKAILANKKDKNYIEIKSYYSFLEVFILSENKSAGIRIPDTILIEHGGNIRCWMFNSKKDDDTPILKKRQDKLTTNEIMAFFSKNTTTGTSMKTKYGTGFFSEKIAKIREYNKPQAIVRYINDQIDLLNLTDLQDYLQTGLSYLKMIQANLDIKSKSEYNSGETYYCEYRQDDNLLPPSYRFVKKVQQFSKPEENISSSCYKSKLLYKGSTKPEETAYSDTMNTPGTITVKETKPRTNLITENSKKFYKVFDVATNQRLEKLTKIFATYMAQSFRVIVKKLVCKFAIDEQNEFYFMGVKELLIEFRDKALAASIDLKEMSLEEMINTTKRHSKEQEAAILLNIDDAPKKKISKIIKEECHGDFCEFISLDSMKLAELASGHNVAKYLKKDKTSERRLPYEITYNLVRRCKQDPEEIKTIFKYHKIFPRYYAELVNDSPQALNHVDFDVKFRKMEHDNFQTLYRFVKVCKNCYPIYVTLQRALTEGETKPIAYPSYRPLTQNMEQSPSHAAYHKMSMTAMSPQTKTSNFNAIDSFKGRTMDVLSEEKKVLNITKAKENNARENLKEIVTGGAGGAPRQPYAKSTESMSKTSKLHRSVQTSQQKERQKTVTQRLILGVSAQSQKFPGVLAPSAEASNRQGHVSRQENKSPASPARLHMSMSLYDKEIFSPKGLTVSVAAGTQEKEEKKDQVDEIHKKALRRIASNVTKVTALDPYSSNKRKSIIKLSGHNKGEKPLLPLTTLYLLAKNLNIHTVLFELKRLLQKRRETRRADKDATSLFHHDLFDSARRIPPFLTTTPKQKMSLDFKMQQKPVLDLQRICNLGGYEPPRNYEDLIKIFVVDEHTAIPYAVITSEIDAFKCNDVVVVCHDLFNNFVEDIDYFMSLARQTKNIKFVLFNLPGQAYTLYKEDHIYNNDFNAALVDSLLEDLAKQDKIDPRIDVFKFIGIGFGANILLYYNSMASDNLFSKSYVFAINPFINVDDILEQSLEKAKEIILETPEHMKEMTNLYFSLNFGNGRLSEQEAYDRMMTNPITKSGRLTVINGILNSFNIHQAVATANCPMVILHTYQNAVASNSHVYNLCHYKGQSFKSPHTTLEDFMADPNGKRLVLHSKGSYLAFEEREPEVLKLIETFLISTQDQNNLLEWIFNEKMLSQIEHDILNLQELELEEVQGYIEKLSDIKKVSKEVRQMFLSEAETFVGRVNEKFRELESKIQKCDENLNSLKKNSQDKLTNKQVSQKNLEKVKAMHEERFQVIQEHMKNIRDHNKEPLNLLLTLAKDLDNIDDKTAAILKASTGKILDQHSNDLMGLINKNQWDFHRLREILETKEESSDVLGEAEAELKQVFSDILDIETTYKNIPSIPLFDHNLSILKAKSIELEIQSIQLRIKLVQISEQVLKYFNKMDIDDKETAKNIEEALEFYSDELVVFMDLLNIGDPVFIKTNTTSDDPNHTNNPGQLYISSKADLETNFGPNVIKKRIEEFKHRVERIIEERKPPASQDFKNRLEDLIAKVDEANDSMSK